MATLFTRQDDAWKCTVDDLQSVSVTSESLTTEDLTVNQAMASHVSSKQVECEKLSCSGSLTTQSLKVSDIEFDSNLLNGLASLGQSLGDTLSQQAGELLHIDTSSSDGTVTLFKVNNGQRTDFVVPTKEYAENVLTRELNSQVLPFLNGTYSHHMDTEREVQLKKYDDGQILTLVKSYGIESQVESLVTQQISKMRFMTLKTADSTTVTLESGDSTYILPKTNYVVDTTMLSSVTYDTLRKRHNVVTYKSHTDFDVTLVCGTSGEETFPTKESVENLVSDYVSLYYKSLTAQDLFNDMNEQIRSLVKSEMSAKMQDTIQTETENAITATLHSYIDRVVDTAINEAKVYAQQEIERVKQASITDNNLMSSVRRCLVNTLTDRNTDIETVGKTRYFNAPVGTFAFLFCTMKGNFDSIVKKDTTYACSYVESMEPDEFNKSSVGSMLYIASLDERQIGADTDDNDTFRYNIWFESPRVIARGKWAFINQDTSLVKKSSTAILFCIRIG